MARARPITNLDPRAPTKQNARRLARERLADMYAYAPYIENPQNIQELHDLRIAAKRVRYTLEIFAEFLPETSKEFVDELAKLQDELGALHDSEVMLALLGRLLLQESATSEGGNGKRAIPEQQQRLLSSDMVQQLLHSGHSLPSERERKGLMDFLHRQEQRRAQSYTTFRQHWDELEQCHFRAAILRMLEEE